MPIKIYDYGMNGEGVAKLDGKVVLIDNALLDEDVEIEVIEDAKNYLKAKTTNIVTKSPNRVAPPCPYFYDCGGCSLQHMNYNEQLKFKTILVKKTLKKVANIEFDVTPCVACDNILTYRNKASFNFNCFKSGFYKENSKNIVEIKSCMLASDNINKVYTLFKNFILSTNNAQFVKNLVVRDIENQILVGVVCSKEIDLSSFYCVLSKEFANIGLYLVLNTRNDSVVLSGKVKHVAGIKEIEITNFNLKYFVDLLGFHQTNINIQNKLYNKVLEYISPNNKVVNGFSGQGLLSGIIAQKAKEVIGIEINKSSHQSAEKLKTDNNLNNITNICADFNKEISKHIKNTNTLILDPSKKGCGCQVMEKINGIENIIYISCNPIALAKDLRELKNYKIEEVIPFDMFPNTNSVETLVKLKKLKGN